MAKEKKPDALPQPPAAAAPVKKKRSKWLLIAPALVVVLAAAGGGVWYWLRPAGDHGAAANEAPKPEKTKPPIFIALETFTVNLQPEGGDRLLQTTFSLKVGDATVEHALKEQMPEIRSRLLLLLSSKRASELSSVAGKQLLAGQIAAEVNSVLHPEAANPAGTEKPAEKSSDKPSGKDSEKAPEKTAEKAAEKVPEKAAEKAPEKAAEKAAEKAPEKAAEKAPAKPPEATPEPAAQPAAAPGPVLSVFFTTFIIQ